MKKRMPLFLALLAAFPLFAQQWSGIRGEIAIPNLKGYVTLKCDFHIHTVFSDGSVWPTERINEAYHEGLDAIAITDHIEVLTHKADIPTAHNRPHEMSKVYARKKNVMLIKGNEITRSPEGHYNALFLTDANPLETPEFMDAVKAAKKQGAFILWNHPGIREGSWKPLQTQLLEEGLISGLEVVTWNSYFPNVHRWCLEKKLTMFGDTDVHGPLFFPPGQHRTMTLVFATESTPAALREALEQRRTAVYWGEYVIGEEKYLQELFENAVTWKATRTATEATVTLTNTSDLSFRLVKSDSDKRVYHFRDIMIAPKSTQTFTVHFLEEGVDSFTLGFVVDNFLVRPDEGMAFKKELKPRNAEK